MEQRNLTPTRGEDILQMPELASGGVMSLQEITAAVSDSARDVRGDVFNLIYYGRLKPIPGVGAKPATYALPQFYRQAVRGRIHDKQR